MSSVPDKIEVYLNLISDKLQITDFHEIVVNFQYSYGLNLIGLVLFILLMYKVNRKFNLLPFENIKESDVRCFVLFNLIFGSFIYTIIVLFVEALSHVLFPEYYAIQEVLNSILD
jgi:hypothetical protein